jgi:uncharacterized protein (DUF305 family)
MSPARWIAAAMIAGTAVTCRTATPGAPLSTSPAPSSEESAAAIAKARADSARYPYTAADIHFMSGMIAHHGQAIAMARHAPANGASAAVRTLAERIINAQQDEIAIMQRWLRDRSQPVPQASATAATPSHHDHAAAMPGMLTAAQLKQLEDAKSAHFDRLFLTFMIQHHNGAIVMVNELLGSIGAAQDQTVFKLASEVNVDQSTEVARMSKMLADLIFVRPPS